MNRFKKIILSMLGGIDVTFYMFTPILIAAIWISLAELSELQMYLFYSLGILATIFRAIKIGWLKNE